MFDFDVLKSIVLVHHYLTVNKGLRNEQNLFIPLNDVPDLCIRGLELEGTFPGILFI